MSIRSMPEHLKVREDTTPDGTLIGGSNISHGFSKGGTSLKNCNVLMTDDSQQDSDSTFNGYLWVLQTILGEL